MAVVYLARQTDLDRLVALKELAAFHAADADFARRFVRESRLAGSLVHPNVITVFDYFEHAGTPYIAMEYVDRGSLRPYVGRMTLAQIGGVLDGLLAGLAEAEQHNIVHRDLKPENLMVTSTGTVKIADFGIAKATQAADTSAFVTATGTTVGTPPYMAPEQAMAKDVGSWTDLYSVGCMAYELFTGKPPFYDTDEPLAILLRHISEALPPASEVADVDPEISAWIERLTAKDPKSRPESATAAWEEFEEILIGKLGPRWRREARLPEPPNRGAEGTSAPPTGADSDEYVSSPWGGATPVPGPAPPPPPTGPAPPMEGIDVEGTGPDTGGDMPPSEEPKYETYLPPPTGPPSIEGIDVEGTGPDTGGDMPGSETAAEPPVSETPPVPPAPEPPAAAPPTAAPPPAPETAESQPEPEPAATRLPQEVVPPPPSEQRRAPVTGDLPVPPQVILLASAGALALLLALAIPLLNTGPDRWNVFAVLSPFEAVGVALGDVDRRAGAARGAHPRLRRRRCAHRVRRPDAWSRRWRSCGSRSTGSRRCGRWWPSSSCSGRSRSSSPASAACGRRRAANPPRASIPGRSCSGSRAPCSPAWRCSSVLRRLQLAVERAGRGRRERGVRARAGGPGRGHPRRAGAAGRAPARRRRAAARGRDDGVLHYLGVIVAAWRAIGEVGEIRSAGFIGVLGGLLVVAAGAWVYRADRAE